MISFYFSTKMLSLIQQIQEGNLKGKENNLVQVIGSSEIRVINYSTKVIKTFSFLEIGIVFSYDSNTLIIIRGGASMNFMSSISQLEFILLFLLKRQIV